MILKRVILHKFKRFFLSGVEHFVYTPESNITIIAWGNGQGKSSLLSQLHPLPADLRKDYREGGYKLIEFQIGADTYIASSGYVAKNKHSLIKNDVELNPGGTAIVQRQLVEEYFKLTPAIFNILLGIENLTTMTPSMRKHWFTMLSPIDYTFSISVWNNLKSRARDLIGSIKILQDDLIKKTKDIINPEELISLQEETVKLDNLITERSTSLVTLVEPNSIYKDTNEVSSLFKRYSRYQSMIVKITNEYPNLSLDIARTNIGKLESELKSYQEQLELKNKSLKTLEALKSRTTLEQLQLVIKEKSSLIEKYQNHLPKNITIGTSDIVEQKLSDICIRVKDILQELLVPELLSIGSRKEQLEIREEFENLRTIYNERKGYLNSIKTSLEELITKTNEHDVICPNCNHKFHYTAKAEIEALKVRISKGEAEISSRVEKLKSLALLDKQYTKKITLLDNLYSILSEPLLSPFLEDISSIPPEAILSKLNEVLVKVSYFKTLDTILVELQELKNKLHIQEEATKVAESLGISSIEKLEEEILVITNKRQLAFKQLDTMKLYIELETNITQILLSIKEYQSYEQDKYKFILDSKRNEILLSSIGNLKLKLSTIQKRLQEVDNNRSILESLQKTIDANKDRLNVLSRMITMLSPEGGLIAKSINSFLNTYLTEMNSIINSVWCYNMELLPCEVDETNDLNYKFKVKVNHDETIEDISKLSSSIQEIVNLAFKIIFVKYLGISGYPLILDEFGRTMDAEHRVNAYDVIDRVLSHNFRQIILVCHYESMYSRFNNADFLELKESRDTTTPEE